MILVNIYSMDDPEGQLIASLGTGVHLLGRGNLLQVADKRVSRKHAIIEVSDHRITLTSIHINPCFFKAANSKTLTIITKNQQNEIKDGDQFALLPESCWYKAKIKVEPPDEPPNTTEKRVHEQQINESCDAKKAKLSTSDLESNEAVPDSRLNGSKNEELANRCVLCPTVTDIAEATSTSVVPKTEKPDEMEFQSTIYIADAPAAKIQLQPDRTGITNKPTLDLPSEIPEFIHEVSREVKQELMDIYEEILEEQSPLVEVKTELVDDESTVVEAPQDNAKASERVDDESKVAEAPQDNAKASESVDDESKVAEATKDNAKAAEPVDDESKVAEAPQYNAKASEAVDDESKVAEASHDNVKAADQPSTSGSATNPPQRERCRYGDTCYRINPSHKTTFSHPGDADYDSDVDRNRPECPYGTACYRMNMDHRRMYKHSTNPAKKPTAQTPKRPKKAPLGDDDGEDDYDYSDPFLNDDSSDDFEISDFGIDSSESDFDDSQEVNEKQEQHRMLREARRFIKRK